MTRERNVITHAHVEMFAGHHAFWLAINEGIQGPRAADPSDIISFDGSKARIEVYIQDVVTQVVSMRLLTNDVLLFDTVSDCWSWCRHWRFYSEFTKQCDYQTFNGILSTEGSTFRSAVQPIWVRRTVCHWHHNMTAIQLRFHKLLGWLVSDSNYYKHFPIQYLHWKASLLRVKMTRIPLWTGIMPGY